MGHKGKFDLLNSKRLHDINYHHGQNHQMENATSMLNIIQGKISFNLLIYSQ